MGFLSSRVSGVRLLATAAALLLLVLGASPACSSDDSTTTATTTCTPDLAGVQTIFAKSCTKSGCHGSTAPAASLDLASDGVEGRLSGIAAGTCSDSTLRVTPGDSGPLAAVPQGQLGQSAVWRCSHAARRSAVGRRDRVHPWMDCLAAADDRRRCRCFRIRWRAGRRRRRRRRRANLRVGAQRLFRDVRGYPERQLQLRQLWTSLWRRPNLRRRRLRVQRRSDGLRWCVRRPADRRFQLRWLWQSVPDRCDLRRRDL